MSITQESFYILRKIAIDGSLLCVLLVNIYFVIPSLWVPHRRGFFCGDESIMYPYKPDTVTMSVIMLLQIAPLFCIFLIEWIHLRKESNDKLCLGMRIPVWLQGSYSTAMCFTFGTCFIELIVIWSKIIGRLRPNFLDVCRPSVDCSLLENKGRYIPPTEFICTANIDNREMLQSARLSFLSGHSALTAFAMVYLIMYLERRITWKGTRLLRHTLQFALIFISVYVSLSRISDNKHHWSDVLAGLSVGIIGAVVMFHHGTDFMQTSSGESFAQIDVNHVARQQMAQS